MMEVMKSNVHQEVCKSHSTFREKGKDSLDFQLPGEYVAGFIDGEGCFTIVISKHRTKKLGVDARLHFQIELRSDDLEILQQIQKTLDCGRIYHLNYERYGWNPHVELKVSSIREITDKLIPFLNQYPLRAKKRLSYQYFLQAVEIFKDKQHLTLEGIEQLRNIRKKMNKFSKKSSVG
jgi:intein-encoded DNA endonuclease-like protein